MNGHRRIDSALWGVALSLTIWAVLRSAGEVVAVTAQGPGMPPHSPQRQGTPANVIAAAAEAVVAKNPFRLERRPSETPFGGGGVMIDREASPAPAPALHGPVLIVAGILGGPPWQALLEGVPEREGSVLVQVGDVIGELRILDIGRDTVSVQDADKTWTLILRTAWQ